MDLENNSAQRQQLQDALLNAFPDVAILARMVDRLNVRLARIVEIGALDHTVFKLIEWALAHGRVQDLVLSALDANRSNPKLSAFAAEVGLINPAPDPNLSPITHAKSASPDNVQPLSRRPTTSFTPLQMPLESFDTFFQLLEETLEEWHDRRLSSFQAAILKSLMHIGNAQHVFIAYYKGNNWELVVENEVKQGWAQDALAHNNDLIELMERAKRQSDLGKNTNPYQSTNMIADWLPHVGQYCLVVRCPLVELNGPVKVLVFYGAEANIQPNLEVATILNSLLEYTDNLETVRDAQELQTVLYNTLKKQFKTVSLAVYERQFKLFVSRLSKMKVFFEPVISLTNPPYITSWEALARDESADPKAPEDLFSTAELWGDRFLLELDTYFLHTAVDTYLSSPDRKQPLRRAWEILDLSVNVYPSSLIRRVYRESIFKVFKEGRMPLNKLILEISEKFDLPKPEPVDQQTGRIEWFNEQLSYYTDRGIRFAIDDFGVGHASPSRLSGLRAAIVKIDRDALLRGDRNRLKYVLDDARSRGGERQVIVEGFGEGTKLTLEDLCRLKVLYVQGHNLTKAVNIAEAERSLMKKIFSNIQRAVQAGWV